MLLILAIGCRKWDRVEGGLICCIFYVVLCVMFVFSRPLLLFVKRINTQYICMTSVSSRSSALLARIFVCSLGSG